MGGLFGVVTREDCIQDLFFGTDYHSHLGTKPSSSPSSRMTFRSSTAARA